MRRRGYTLIEVLVVLAISLAALTATVQLGRQWWRYTVEEQFFRDFARNWRYLMTRGRVDHVNVQVEWAFQSREFLFRRFGPGPTAVSRLSVPSSLVVQLIMPTSTIDWPKDQLFTEIRTYSFVRASGRHVTFTSQLGWGELIRTNL